MEVSPDRTMVCGIERHTFKCSGCAHTAKRDAQPIEGGHHELAGLPPETPIIDPPDGRLAAQARVDVVGIRHEPRRLHEPDLVVECRRHVRSLVWSPAESADSVYGEACYGRSSGTATHHIVEGTAR